MSKLLERAIVDAKALKEAALRSAEQLVIEKYSEEVKEAVDNIIEQDLGSDLGLDMGALDTGDELGMEPTGEDPVADAQETEDTTALDPESLMGGLPDSFNVDDDEVISIKLDSLDAEYDDDDGPFAGDDEYADDEIGIDILDDEEFEDDEEFDLSGEADMDTDPTGDIGIDISSDMVQEVLD